MKLHFEIDADGYYDILKDAGKSLNLLVDNFPAFMLKVRSIKDFVETVAKADADKRANELSAIIESACKSQAPAETDSQTEEAPAVEAPAAPAEEAPEIKKEKDNKKK